jgi:protein-ribulosamine 3-kinase
MPAAMAAAEARGLELLGATNTVRVPMVIGEGQNPPFLLIEDLAGDRSGGPTRTSLQELDSARLGAELAALHAVTAPAFGLDHDNFIGRTPQQNSWLTDWPQFFRARRLLPQLELAGSRGRMPTARRRGVEAVMARLDDILGHAPPPSLIHGDLWGGNVVGMGDGRPCVIDPACSYSDREADLAMTRLFGGFAPQFYSGYEETWPLPPGADERVHIYNLYHLLNHLNLFGESYSVAVEGIVRRYK